MRAGRDAVLKTVVGVAAVVMVISSLREWGGFFLPMLTALFLAVISAPVVRFLEGRFKLPVPIAIILTLLIDMGLLAGFVALLATSLEGLQGALPRYQDAFTLLVHDTVAALEAWGLEVSDDVLADLRDSRMMNAVGDVLGELAHALSNTVLVVLLLAFLMFETRAAREKLNVLLGRASSHLARMALAAQEVQRYLIVKTVLSVLTAVLSGCWLAVCGVDFPLLWGLLTFVFNYIPSIGPAISLVPPVVISLLTLGPGGAALVATGHLSIGMVIGNVLEPRMMGQQLGLSTLVVFVSMFFWGWMWGPIGALFAVPLTMLLRSAAEPFEETRWIAVLLGSTEWVDRKRREWGWSTAEEKKRASDQPPAISAPGGPPSIAPPADAASSATDELPRKAHTPAE